MQNKNTHGMHFKHIFHLGLYVHRVRKKGATLFLPVTLRNANRFSKFFYRHTLH